MPVVGFLHLGKADAKYNTDALAEFRKGLKGAGYNEGQNVAIEYRWAEDQYDRLPGRVTELVRRHVDVIIAGGGAPAAVAAKAATSTIPIVLAFGSDPVELGLVASLNHPGGNITGVTFMTTELAGKRVDLLRELVPQAMTVAYLVHPLDQTVEIQTGNTLATARALGLQVIVLEVRSDRDFEAAFANLVQRRAGALILDTARGIRARRNAL